MFRQFRQARRLNLIQVVQNTRLVIAEFLPGRGIHHVPRVASEKDVRIKLHDFLYVSPLDRSLVDRPRLQYFFADCPPLDDRLSLNLPLSRVLALQFVVYCFIFNLICQIKLFDLTN